MIYELHVGTFTPEGTWRAAADELPRAGRAGRHAGRGDAGGRVRRRRSAGATTASTCSRRRGCTARPTTFAVSSTGRTRRGLGVMLDVVYNHFGPTGNYLGQFSDDYLSPTPSHRLGRRRSTSTATNSQAGARVLHRQRRLLDRRIPHRRPAARRRARHRRRLARAHRQAGRAATCAGGRRAAARWSSRKTNFRTCGG